MKKRVLIVEDEIIIARDIESKLRGLGYDTPPSSPPEKRPLKWPGSSSRI